MRRLALIALLGLVGCVTPSIPIPPPEPSAMEFTVTRDDTGAITSASLYYPPTQNYCGRIRGDILNLTALICGNRFGRGLVVPGGVRHSMDPARCVLLLDRLKVIERDLYDAIPLMFETPSVMARMEGTGIVTNET